MPLSDDLEVDATSVFNRANCLKSSRDFYANMPSQRRVDLFINS